MTQTMYIMENLTSRQDERVHFSYQNGYGYIRAYILWTRDLKCFDEKTECLQTHHKLK